MSTSLLIPQDDESTEKGITSDFMYGNNVASSHIYIRMGKLDKLA